MKSKWDAKSVMIGALLGAVVVMATGAALAPRDLPGSIGRFQISAGDLGRAFVVDTASGQVWVVTERSGLQPKLQ